MFGQTNWACKQTFKSVKLTRAISAPIVYIDIEVVICWCNFDLKLTPINPGAKVAMTFVGKCVFIYKFCCKAITLFPLCMMCSYNEHNVCHSHIHFRVLRTAVYKYDDYPSLLLFLSFASACHVLLPFTCKLFVGSRCIIQH